MLATLIVTSAVPAQSKILPKYQPGIIKEVPIRYSSEAPDLDDEIAHASATMLSEVCTYRDLGTFSVYAYCPCFECCSKRPGDPGYKHTKTGTIARQGKTVAVDPRVIPLGSVITIDGAEYVAEDTGSGIKGKKIDMYFEQHQDAVNWGVKTLEVSIREVANGN